MKKASVSIVLADNQPLTAAGLLSFLSDRQDFQVVEHLMAPENLLDSVVRHKPDLLIADYNLSGFITLSDLQDLYKATQNINVLIISADNNQASILEVLQLGIKGYLTKDCSKEEVLLAVQSTAKGEKFFSHKILNIIMEKHLSLEREDDIAVLTNRETEILKLLAQGQSTQKIADVLFLSPHTVQTHRKSIIRKLNIKSPTEFVIHALDMGIIKTKQYS